MEIIKSLLDKLYSSQNGMMYFYIGSAVIALILIALIIITIVKGSKEEEKVSKERSNDSINHVDDTKVSEIVNNGDLLVDMENDKEEVKAIDEDIIVDNHEDASIFHEEHIVEDKQDAQTSALETVDFKQEELKEEDYELPKVKEVVQSYSENNIHEDKLKEELSNDILEERLKALKNRN